MEAVLDEYEKPYDPDCPVVCLDESPKQLIGEARNGFTDRYGVEHVDYEYTRNGVRDLYMIVEPKGGKRQVLVKPNHNQVTYAQVIAHIAESMYPRAKQITVIEDNLSAHKLSALYQLYPPEKARQIIKRIQVVRTPAHGSWLNVAESELSVLTRQGLSKRVDNEDQLQQQVSDWYQTRNDKHTKIQWAFTTKDARIKLKHLYPKFNT
jgi:hypothetical protein